MDQNAREAPMVLVAPDSFKGTMTATTVATALAEGVAGAGGLPHIQVLGDGGEGTTEALRDAWGGDNVRVEAEDPLGRPVQASFMLTRDGRVAVVETAAASGLDLIADAERGPQSAWAASTRGTGQLLAAAARSGAEEILLAVGGSATTDGGAGALAAIAEDGGLHGVPVTVLCDVATTFLDAASVYGPQKGANADTVDALTRRLDDLAATWPRDPRGVPRTGAAGGLSGAMWAHHNAQLVSGIDYLLDILRIDEVLKTAACVITGEGRLDSQTQNGKVVWGLSRRARTHGVPVWVVAGDVRVSKDEQSALGLAGAVPAGDPVRLKHAAAEITELVCDLS